MRRSMCCPATSDNAAVNVTRQCLLLALFTLLLQGRTGAEASSTSMELTPQELDWIAANPVLRVGVFDNLVPFEYISRGQLQGLSAEYLQLITLRTGLHFKYVITTTRSARKEMLVAGDVDILSTRRRSDDPSQDIGMLYTLPYNSSATVLVSRLGAPPFADLKQLAGKRLAMLGREGGYFKFVKEEVPSITVIPALNAVDMMAMVKDGEADAAIASEWLLIPYLSRQYRGVLQISGVVPQLHTGVSMAVRDDDLILFSILQKALASVTGDERKAIYDTWFAEMSLDIPTINAIAEHYDVELWLLLILTLLLVMLIWQSRVQRSRAAHREREKAMFLAVMSHEIRSPMNAILAAVELLEQTPLDEQQRHFTGLANSGANTLLRLVDDVLDISKIEAGQFTLSLEPVNLWALAQRVVSDYQPYAEEKGLELKLVGERFTAPMLLDEIRLAQILRNLVSNAIKFTDVGQVEVQLKILGSVGDISRVQIRVIDSGVGVSEQAQLSLFQPYGRYWNSYKSTGGTGLGLVICRRLVNLMQGKLKLTSAPGGGTLVEVVLPGRRATLQSSPSQEGAGVIPATDTAEVGSRLQVLVVGGSLASQQEVVAQLHGLDCEVLQAADSTEGMAIFDAHRVDMVLMNYDLSEDEDYSLAAVLRGQEQELQRSHCPIVALSANADNDHLERYFDAGIDGLLAKPIRPAKLQQMIELWCDVSLLMPQAQPLFERKQEGLGEYAELCSRLRSLIEAVALRDRSWALQALHQLRDEALAIGWVDITTPINVIEQLLGDDVNWLATAISEPLGVLLKQCAELLCVPAG